MTDSVLITGGAGFIGRSLISKLIELNPDLHIRVLDNFSVGSPEDLQDVCSVQDWAGGIAAGVHIVRGDIRDFSCVQAATEGVGCIVHLAANTGVGPSVEEPRFDMESNVIGTLNMLEAARHSGVNKFVFASSGAPAGAVEPPIHEEIAPHPVSPYGASKLAGEGYCSAYYHSFGINTIALRFGNVYGPNSAKKSSVVAKFIRQAMSDETCEIYGSGVQTRDYIYIDDLVSAIICAMQRPVGGEVFQIAVGAEVTLLELVEKIRASLIRYGIDMRVTNTDLRIGDVLRNYADIRKAREVLGWEPQFDLQHGLDKTVEYFVNRSLS
jgi:UDP-glucose 4-epimerase